MDINILWQKTDKIALGLSGGVDSIALFHLLVTKYKESYKELIISAVIPIEVGMFSTFYSAGNNVSEFGTSISILISAIILSIIVTVNYLECKEEIGFISDFNEIIFPSKIHRK